MWGNLRLDCGPGLQCPKFAVAGMLVKAGIHSDRSADGETGMGHCFGLRRRDIIGQCTRCRNCRSRSLRISVKTFLGGPSSSTSP